MLDSNPVKVINLVAAVLTIGTAIGGALTGIAWKGDDWGTPFAATVFGFAFAVACLLLFLFVLAAYVLVGKLRRNCPVCNGNGKVTTRDEYFLPTGTVCPKCKGDGVLW